MIVLQTRTRSNYGSPSPKYSFSRQGHPSNGTGLTIITAPSRRRLSTSTSACPWSDRKQADIGRLGISNRSLRGSRSSRRNRFASLRGAIRSASISRTRVHLQSTFFSPLTCVRTPSLLLLSRRQNTKGRMFKEVIVFCKNRLKCPTHKGGRKSLLFPPLLLSSF